MLTTRIIPCLDVKDGRTVKGTRFLDLKDAGDPVDLAARYSDEGADELVFLDITASWERRSTLLDLVDRAARAIRIPFAVGGGIRTVDDVLRTLDAGADKVTLNTAILARPELLAESARRVGSQSLVAAIDARREGDGWTVWSHGGRVATGMDALAWAERAVELGAGELLVTSMDRDGTREGYDVDLLRAVTGRVEVPVIASGGAGTPDHFVSAARDGRATGLLAAGLFHYQVLQIHDIKQHLHFHHLAVRL